MFRGPSVEAPSLLAEGGCGLSGAPWLRKFRRVPSALGLAVSAPKCLFLRGGLPVLGCFLSSAGCSNSPWFTTGTFVVTPGSASVFGSPQDRRFILNELPPVVSAGFSACCCCCCCCLDGSRFVCCSFVVGSAVAFVLGASRDRNSIPNGLGSLAAFD